MKYNSVKTYYNELVNVPLYDDSVIEKLFKKYRYGDYEAKAEIINRSMHLVYEIALKYQRFLSFENFQEIISIGNVELINAVSGYVLNPIPFKTYASKCIKKAIIKYLRSQCEYLRIDDNLRDLVSRYHETINRDNCKCHLNYLSMMIELNVDRKLLLDILNLHTLIYVDKDSNMDYQTKEFLVVLKNSLSNIEYYILYYRLYSNTKLSMNEIAARLNISISRCNEIFDVALDKLLVYKDKSYISLKAEEIRSVFKNISNLKTEPFSNIKMCAFNYLKKYLSSLEIQILYLYLFDAYCYTDEDYLYMFKLNDKQYKKIIADIAKKIEMYIVNNYQFKEYMNGVETFYGELLFEYDQNKELIDYAYLNNKFAKLSYDDFINLYGSKFYILSFNTVALLNRYFNTNVVSKATHSFEDIKNIINKRFGIMIDIDFDKKTIINFMQNYSSHIYDIKYSIMFYFDLVERDLITSKELYNIYEAFSILDKEEPISLKKIK